MPLTASPLLGTSCFTLCLPSSKQVEPPHAGFLDPSVVSDRIRTLLVAFAICKRRESRAPNGTELLPSCELICAQFTQEGYLQTRVLSYRHA